MPLPGRRQHAEPGEAGASTGSSKVQHSMLFRLHLKSSTMNVTWLRCSPELKTQTGGEVGPFEMTSNEPQETMDQSMPARGIQPSVVLQTFLLITLTGQCTTEAGVKCQC